jgi:hypothetical protein
MHAYTVSYITQCSLSEGLRSDEAEDAVRRRKEKEEGGRTLVILHSRNGTCTP